MSELAKKLDALIAQYYNGVHFDTIEPLAPLLAATARDAAAYRVAQENYYNECSCDEGWGSTARADAANTRVNSCRESLDASLAALAKEIG